jgi:polynucleotide 5'-hydroxyl-kinase GRC3/NOL9
MIIGEKDMGKSTLIRYMVNRATEHLDSYYDATYFDYDLGQCEFTMSGCVSYVHIDSPLLGPPYSHIRSHPKPDRLLCYGHVAPHLSPVHYLQCINRLRQLWNIDRKDKIKKRSLLLINTMGWGTGKH